MAKTLREQFEDFDAAHPDVYGQFVEVVFDIYNLGHSRYSAYAAMHVVRWFRLTSGQSPKGFKVQNNFIPFYARKLIDDYPQLDGFIQTREMWVNG